MSYTCTNCGATHSHHTGHLYQEAPGAPELDPPIELRRCLNCHQEFRADGEPWTSAGHAARWTGAAQPARQTDRQRQADEEVRRAIAATRNRLAQPSLFEEPANPQPIDAGEIHDR